MVSRTTIAVLALLTLGACQGLVPAPTIPSPAPVPSTPVPELSTIPPVEPTDVPADPSLPDTTIPAEPATYTMVDVALHATPDDCWFVIAGTVYDASGYGERHGGGDAVYEGCGKDATALFETRPMGSGTPHSEKARGFLPNFEIGKLAE